MTKLAAGKEKVLSGMDFPISRVNDFVGQYYFILTLCMLGNFS